MTAEHRYLLDGRAVDADTFRHAAIDPARSVVVDACAGSGKTTLLVARIVRALLDGAEPDEVLAVTFTRLAAHEMRERLMSTLRAMSLADDATLRARLIADYGLRPERADALAAPARGLYERVLCHPRPPEITTFHRWFRTLGAIGPLADVSGEGGELTEDGAALLQQAWYAWLDVLHSEGWQARRADFEALVHGVGLSNARACLQSFVEQRADWAVSAQVDLDAALDALEAAAERSAAIYARTWREAATALVAQGAHRPPDTIADADALMRAMLTDTVVCAAAARLASILAPAGNKAGRVAADVFAAHAPHSAEVASSRDVRGMHEAFDALRAVLLGASGQPLVLPITPTSAGKLDAAGEGDAVRADWAALCARVGRAQALRAEWPAVALNAAALRCGVGLLDAFREVKRAQGVIDFADLESIAWRMLRDPATAAYLQCRMDRRYRHLLFDEFQDTSSLQWRMIVDWLQSYAGAGERPSVFVVGDPKQSIYRFRRAEARVFDAAKKLLREGFDVREAGTDTTWRNAPAIVAALNACLPPGMPHYREQATAAAARVGLFWRLPLVDGVASTPGDADATEFDWLTSARADEASLRHLEGARIADAILAARATLAAQGHAIAWRDVFVLARNRTHFEAYERALRDRGLPVRSDRAGGLLGSLEGDDLRALLSFVRRPSDDLALAQVLASPLIGLDAAAIGWIASHAPADASDRDDAHGSEDAGEGDGEGEGDDARIVDATQATQGPDTMRPRRWWPRLRALAAVPPTGDPAPFDLAAVVARLAAWVERSARLPAHDFLDAVLAEVDAFSRYPAAVDPAQREVAHANLCAMLGLALDVDAGRFPSLARFLRRLRGYDSLDERERPSEGRGDAVDAIRLMTIHASKGLEAALVVLADANAQPRPDGARLHVDWEPERPRPDHLSFVFGGEHRGVARDERFDRERGLREREDSNLLYVALTRAKLGVIVTGTRSRVKSAQTWWTRLDPAQPPPDDIVAPSSDASAGSPHEPFAMRLLALPPLGVGSPRDPGESAGERDADGAPAGLLATELGHALHRALELLPDGRDDATVLAALHAYALADAQRRAALERARVVLALAPLRAAFDTPHAACELEIVDALGQLRRIDRVARVGDELWVIDYKWSVDAARRPAYRDQLAGYRALVAQLDPPPFGPVRRVRTVLVDAAAARVEFDVDLGAARDVDGPAAGG